MYKEKIAKLLNYISDSKNFKEANCIIKYGIEGYDYNGKNKPAFDYIYEACGKILKYGFYRKAYFPRYINKNIYEMEITNDIDHYRIDTLKDLVVQALKYAARLNYLCAELHLDPIFDLDYQKPITIEESDKICMSFADEYIGGIEV